MHSGGANLHLCRSKLFQVRSLPVCSVGRWAILWKYQQERTDLRLIRTAAPFSQSSQACAAVTYRIQTSSRDLLTSGRSMILRMGEAIAWTRLANGARCHARHKNLTAVFGHFSSSRKISRVGT